MEYVNLVKTFIVQSYRHKYYTNFFFANNTVFKLILLILVQFYYHLNYYNSSKLPIFTKNGKVMTQVL